MNRSVATKSGRVNLRDIAQLAGVSVSTASAVLSGKASQSRISAEVERRVREVALEHDYAPNLLMRSMQQGRTNVLAFYSAFGDQDRGDLFKEKLVTAIMRAAGQFGYDVLVHCNSARPAEEIYRVLNGGRADGLLFGPHRLDPLLPLLRTSRLPTVLVNRVDDEGILSSVSDDMQEGMRQVADELARLGHRRIAALTGPGRSSAAARIAALRERLAVYGIALPERWIVPVFHESGYSEEDALRFLMAEPEPPTALFCWHDRIGYSALSTCKRLGISVPGQLSLVGYDGLQWPSTSGHFLTSVDVSLDTLSETAIQVLDNLIQGRAEAPVRRVVPVTLSQGTTLGSPTEDSK